MHKVEISHSAFKELEKIYRFYKKLYVRLMIVIESLSDIPTQGKKLKGQFKSDYSLRVGSYRIIYTIDKGKLIVFIIDVGHRKGVYR